MLIDGHEIESDLERTRLWEQLVALETIGEWSAFAQCVSPDSDQLQPATSFVCTHSNGRDETEATVIVTGFEPEELLTLRTTTPMADLHERIELSDRPGGSLLTYSVDATSSAFGPSVTLWLRMHVNHVCAKLETFARRSLV